MSEPHTTPGGTKVGLLSAKKKWILKMHRSCYLWDWVVACSHSSATQYIGFVMLQETKNIVNKRILAPPKSPSRRLHFDSQSCPHKRSHTLQIDLL